MEAAMLTRRQFIKWLSAAGFTSATAALLEQAGCTSPRPTAVPTRSPVAPTAPPPTAAATAARPAASTAEATASPAPTPLPTYLSVAHGDDPAEITRRAVNAIGG